MKFSVYVETSLVSYLTAPQNQNIITAANQLMTQEWWKNYRSQFELFTSQLVIDEASQGNATEVSKRLAILKDMNYQSFVPLMNYRRDHNVMERFNS